jgi:hypothetical protein
MGLQVRVTGGRGMGLQVSARLATGGRGMFSSPESPTQAGVEHYEIIAADSWPGVKEKM